MEQNLSPEGVRALYAAAAAGDLVSLRSLDRRILRESSIIGRCTPLHVAAMLGNSSFVAELLKMEPMLAQMQDFEGMSALHLATAYGHLEVVKVLVAIGPEMCLMKDRRGRNSIHIAVIEGRMEILRHLVEAKPEAALVCTDQNETVLHLCVTNSQPEILGFLVDNLANVRAAEFVNSRDNDGFTVLHLAVMEKHAETIPYLLEETAVDVNMLNSSGYTALDMVQSQSRRNMKDQIIINALRSSGATSSNISSSPRRPKSTVEHSLSGNKRGHTSQMHIKYLEKKRNTLMVVASLIASITYQAGIALPTSLTSEKMKGSPTKNYNNEDIFYGTFLFFNTVGFVASLYVILLLISGLPIKRKFFMWILIVAMWISVISIAMAYGVYVYPFCIYMNSSDSSRCHYDEILYWTTYVPAIVSPFLLATLILGHLIRLTIKAVKLVKTKLRRKNPDRPNLPN